MKTLFALLLSIVTISLSAQTQVEFHTNYGNFRAQIVEDLVPITGGNFLSLVDSGFYDGIIFHRVISDFMIQGGDPTGTGSGGSDETIELEIHDSLVFDSAGVMGMARTNDPNSASSQFFITVEETAWLTGNYAIFGYIINGQNVVDSISETETNSSDRPLEDIYMCTVRRVAEADSVFEQVYTCDTSSSIAEVNRFSLNAFPNPFTDVISFTLPEVSDVVIRLIDIQGREVLQLQERAVPAGDYNFRNSKVS